MGHTPGAHKRHMERERLAAADAAERERDALAIVDAWNTTLARGRRPQQSPTLEAAIRARRPWLHLGCSGCRTVYAVDLRTIQHPQDMPVMALRDRLMCRSRCRGEGPAPTLLGLHAGPP